MDVLQLSRVQSTECLHLHITEIKADITLTSITRMCSSGK